MILLVLNVTVTDCVANSFLFAGIEREVSRKNWEKISKKTSQNKNKKLIYK